MSDTAPAAPSGLPPTPPIRVEVLPAAAFCLASGSGSAKGAGLGRPEDASPGDIYRLQAGTRPLILCLAIGKGPPRIAPGSDIGRAGAALRVLGEHLLVAEDGDTIRVLALSVAETGRFVLPLGPLVRGLDYRLIHGRALSGDLPLPDRVAAAFARGTAILLADASPCPVERLDRGAMILTRDNGPRPLRALLHARLRAAGEQAPVVIAPGTIGNAGELVLSPHHRILLHRPGGRPGGAEAFVQARHLVDGHRIRRREIGYVDYFSLVFDAHEVIYAEGFPCESLCLTPALAQRLPGQMAAGLGPGLQGQHQAARPTPETHRPDLRPFLG